MQPPLPPAPQQQQPSTSPSMEAMMLEEIRYLRASMEHMQLQQSSNHRGIITRDQFTSYLAWPGDMYFFPGGSGAAGADNTGGAARANFVGGGYDGRSSGAAAEKALGAQFQSEDFDTDFDRVTRGD
ncbi:hypothetical protein VNO78_34362 [Psophocarpus tetragonolobus]|uniref:Uncharacterized protein n=1 Tax=Psophocarpus tetragonolobus TaxID=3891 RepID=A0AAN9P1Z9_PSOTE